LTPSEGLSISLTGPSNDTAFSYDQYGPVTPVDTLWGIASKLRPDRSVSVQQTMVALYKINPYAFQNDDINKIISSSMLNVPTLALIQAQTNQEAIALINKYAPKKTAVAKPAVVEKPAKVVEQPVETPVVIEVPPAVIAENELYKEKAETAESRLSELEKELELLSEQFIVATETTQALKIKLQPLNDQINALSEQVEDEITIQKELQLIIDEYRAQLDAIEPAPFSGDGLLNEILRFITSSLTNLLIVIISPLLLLSLLFIAISRMRSKRQLAEQEQEMAESTAILMEESGQFDELLTGDIEEPSEDKDDSFEETEVETPENIDLDEAETIDLTDDASLDIIDLTEEDESFEDIDLDEIDLDEIELDDVEKEANDDDPFGIGELTDDIESMPEIELDEGEFESSEDDPFGIGALADDIENSSDTEENQSEDDPFGIGALVDDEELISTESTEAVSDAEQADLDLAAEWEAQVAAESETQTEETADETPEESVQAELDEEFDATDIDALDDLLANNSPEPLEDSEDLIAEAPDLDDLLANNSPEPLEDSEDLIAEAPDLDDLLDNNSTDSALDADSEDGSAPEVDEEVSALVTSEEDLDDLLESNALEMEPSTDAVKEIDDIVVDELSVESIDSSDDDLAETDVEPEIDEIENTLNDLSVDEPIEANTEQTPELEIDDLEALDVDDLTSELLAETNVDDQQTEELPSLNLDDLETELPNIDADDDLLAKQISDVAFNEEVELPTVSEEDEDFIDIETLLENSGGTDKDEPYTELDLDLGLEEFPDVVELQENVDIDDDENGVGAQLDLARAYLEIDDKAAAKDILLSVVDNSNGKQRTEIDKLLSRLT
jgi:pilus assembly protein FimV